MVKINSKGFSLIELLVVVAILGVLAGIAIPIYSNYRTKAYRSAAMVALSEGAQNMERYFTRWNSYAGTPAPTEGDTAAGAQVQQWTDGNRYELSIEANDATTFTLRATPQFVDSKCGYLEINQAGNRTSEIGDCW